MMTHRTITWEAHGINGPALLRELPSIVPRQLGDVTPIIATVLTLGIYVKNVDHQDWTGLAESVAKRHPARIVIIAPDHHLADGLLDITYTAVIRDAQASQAPVLFSECLELTLHEPLATYWIDVVQPLIKADLPSYLWWLGAYPQGHFRWDLLGTGFNHLIIDSHDSGTFPWLPSIYAARRAGMRVDDLEWVRLHPWRLLWAMAADDPRALDVLVHPELIACADTASRCQLMLGWLASRANWTPDSPPSFSWRDGSRPVAVIAKPPNAPVQWQFQRHDWRLEILNQGQAVEARLLSPGGTPAARWVEPFTAGDSLEPILHLLTLGHDVLYEECLLRSFPLGDPGP